MPLDAQTEREYWVSRKGVAVMDLSIIGRLKMTGADALDLLHRLCTQDIKHLKPGEGRGAVLTNEKGRILDVINVHVFPDHLFLFTTVGVQGKTMAWIEKYTITEDVQTADITAETGQISFAGARAGELAVALAGPEIASLPRCHHRALNVGGPEAFIIIGGTFGGGASYNIVLRQRKDTPKALDYLLAKGEIFGADLVGPRVRNVLRIEAGAPMPNKDYDENFNPLEAGFQHHISFSKGCYIGQEVIARLDTYQKVQRHLVGLYLPEEEPPQNGDKLFAGERQTGVITSSAYSPSLSKQIALAYVRTGDATPGTKLVAKTEQGEKTVEVTTLPFLL